MPGRYTSIIKSLTYQFPNFNSAAIEVYEWISNFTAYLVDM